MANWCDACRVFKGFIQSQLRHPADALVGVVDDF